MTTLKLTIITTLALCSLSFSQEKDTKVENKPLSQEVWNKYFKLEHQKKNRSWKVTMNYPLSGDAMTFKAIEKFKGEKDGWIQLASVLVGGPYDGGQNKKSLKVSERGKILKEEDKEIIKVPFPLTLGQTWQLDDATITFDRFEDYETPTQTISKCIVLITKSKEGTTSRWYSVEHGSFFAVQIVKLGSTTSILEDVK